MDEIESLLNAFADQQPTDARGFEYAGKTQIIDELAEIIIEANGFIDKRILRFLLNVLADKYEHDLARVDILKIFEYSDLNEEDHLKTGQTILHVMMDGDDNYLVREWAARVIQGYMDVKDTIEACLELVLNTEEDIILRENAFGALRNLGPTDQTVKAMQTFVQRHVFQEKAVRALDKWGII